MAGIHVTQLADDKRADLVFEVVLPGKHIYTVSVSNEYYAGLTDGNIPPEKLVEKSFEFLLERENPESILKEFDLPLINRYFPEFEETIRRKL